jgi:hypothetical protein
VFDDAQRSALVKQVARSLLSGVREPVVSRALAYWKSIDPGVGQSIEDNVRAGNRTCTVNPVQGHRNNFKMGMSISGIAESGLLDRDQEIELILKQQVLRELSSCSIRDGTAERWRIIVNGRPCPPTLAIPRPSLAECAEILNHLFVLPASRNARRSRRIPLAFHRRNCHK